MRALIGLAALAASVNGAITVTNVVTGSSNINNGGTTAVTNLGTSGQQVGATDIRITYGAAYGTGGNANAKYIAFTGGDVNGVNGVTTGGTIGSTSRVQQQAFQGGNVPYAVTQAFFQFNFNTLVAEVQYLFITGKTQQSQNCDPCDTQGGTTPACTLGGNGPATNTNVCAGLTGRVYQVDLPVGADQFQVVLYDWEGSQTASNLITYSFAITRGAQLYFGDPQLIGMQGQDFQVHGMPDEIFNMVTYPNVQVNARFTYLSEAECPDNYTACFAHPGTYISEQGVRVGKDKVHVLAGPAKKGLTVKVNGRLVTESKTKLHMGSVEIVNKRRVVVKTPIAAFTMTNSDNFMNQESDLFDSKLLRLGNDRVILKAGESFHPEVPLHGLQGQTWRNVEYPSGLEYEGSIMDYHVVSGNIYGKDFVFNKFDL